MSEKTIGAFYHDPPIWLGLVPTGSNPAELIFANFNQEIARGTLSCGIEYRASVEGVFSLDFSEWEPGLPEETPEDAPDFDKWADSCTQRTQIMNAFLAFFYSRMIFDQKTSLDRMVVTPEYEISSANLDMTGTQSYDNGRVVHLANSRHPTTYSPLYPPIADHRINMRRGPFPGRVVELAAEDLSRAMQEDDQQDLLLLDLFLRGSKAYQDHNHSVSVISYWAIVEKLLHGLWSKFLDARSTEAAPALVDSPGCTTDKNPRKFFTAAITENLSRNDIISPSAYANLNTARDARNDWIHNLGTVDRSHAEAARRSCEELFELTKGFKLSGASNLRAHN